MTKLKSALPDGHGLDAVRHKLLGDPRLKHVAVTVLDCATVTIDYEKGGKEPTAAIRTIEVVHPEDLALTQQILTRARDRRLGATVLPIGVEDDITSAFRTRSEDVTTDLADDVKHLDKVQAKELGASIELPLRHELGRAISALRDNKDWVTLGRARRVLQVVLQRLEENDKTLLRNAAGVLVDPATGEVVDEERLTSEDLDRMVADLDKQEKEGQGEQPDSA